MLIPQSAHRLFKRYQSGIETAAIAAMLGALVAVVLLNIPVYPQSWSPVLVAVVVLLGLRYPLPAYLAAVAVVLYPLYTISIYLAVIFFAVAVLLQRPLSHYLGATVLIVAVPWLAKYQLHWVVPILAGLWWGALNGFWIAGLAALWGKVLGGMSGANIDWLLLAGKMPSVAAMAQRFHGLPAIDTLNKLLQPFAPDSTVLLYHLMQIVLWASVAALVGILGDSTWLHRRFYPWLTIFAAALGGIGLAAGHFLLSLWLPDVAPQIFPWEQVFVTMTLGVVIAGSFDVTRRFLDLPLAPAPRKQRTLPRLKRLLRSEKRQKSKAAADNAPIPVPNLPAWEPPQENNDLILLELD